MEIYRDPYTKLNRKTVVALGCFDGVHTAHARVISEAVRIAAEGGYASCVWCFSEPPKNIYLPSPVPLITDAEEKSRRIAALGVDVLISPDFTREIAMISPREFVTRLLCECASAVHLVCGRNYTFGAGGIGDVKMLGELCGPLGIGLSVIDDVSVCGIKVSSTLIREAVTAGGCAAAAHLLGRPFSSLATRSEAGYMISQKQLAPREGEYDVTVSDGEREIPTHATVKATTDGATILLPDDITADEIRVYFNSNEKGR